jgi:hypothetical protein
LAGLDSVTELRDLLASSLLPDTTLDEWRDVAADVVDEAAFFCVRKRFEKAWTRMLIGALLGTVGIVAFVWAANPPKAEESPRTESSVFVVSRR